MEAVRVKDKVLQHAENFRNNKMKLVEECEIVADEKAAGPESLLEKIGDACLFSMNLKGKVGVLCIYHFHFVLVTFFSFLFPKQCITIIVSND